MSVFNGYLMSLTEHTDIKKVYFLLFMEWLCLLADKLLKCDLDANMCVSWKLSYSFNGMG